MKLLFHTIKSCRECYFSRFTRHDLECRFYKTQCGAYKKKSIKLLNDFPEWCPLEDEEEQCKTS
jgi:hypothetical protein